MIKEISEEIFLNQKTLSTRTMERRYKLLCRSKSLQETVSRKVSTKEAKHLSHCQDAVAQGNLRLSHRRLCSLIKRRWPSGVASHPVSQGT